MSPLAIFLETAARQGYTIEVYTEQGFNDLSFVVMAHNGAENDSTNGAKANGTSVDAAAHDLAMILDIKIPGWS